jgi:hypothetical protein
MTALSFFDKDFKAKLREKMLEIALSALSKAHASALSGLSASCWTCPY